MRVKVIRVELSGVEYRLLREYAESRGLTMMEAAREIIRRHVLEDKVYPDDPIFREGPAVRGGARENTSERHDEVLYGEEH